MKLIAVSQRVDTSNQVGERRDAIDKRWWNFFLQVTGILPLILPNNIELARPLLLNYPVDGFLLTGGNSLAALGGDAPERDLIDNLCIGQAINQRIPLLGVCRGMQSIQSYFGQTFTPLEGHVSPRQQICRQGKIAWVNSYHQWGCMASVPELQVTAQSCDGVVKAIAHSEYSLTGIMWHPEREQSATPWDLTFFRQAYNL